MTDKLPPSTISGMAKHQHRICYETFAVGILGLLLFTIGIGDQEFIGFETRFGIFAREMLAFGPSVFPTTYGEPYPDYPSTSTLLIWLLTQFSGQVTKLSTVVPTAFAAAVNLAITYRLLRYVSVQWALLAVCFELGTVTFLTHARSISIDQMLATVTVACFFLVYRNDFQRDNSPWWRPMPGIFILLTFGFSLRGPMGIVLPSGVLCSYYLMSSSWCTKPRWQPLITFGFLASLLLCLSCIALYYLARREGGDAFANEVLQAEFAGRLQNESHSTPGYYFINSIGNYALSFLPAMVVMALIAPRLLRREWDEPLRMAALMAAWTLILLLGLSIPQTQKSRYLLPVVPAIAALASFPFITRNNKPLAMVRIATHALFFMLPALCLVLLFYAIRYADKHNIALPEHLSLLMIVLAACQFTAVNRSLDKKNADRGDRWIVSLGVIALWSTNLWLREPLLTQLHAARPFVQRAEQLRREQPAPMVFYRLGKDNAALRYRVNADIIGFYPHFTDTPEPLKQLATPYYLMVCDSDIAAIQNTSIKLPLPAITGFFDGDVCSVYFVQRI